MKVVLRLFVGLFVMMVIGRVTIAATLQTQLIGTDASAANGDRFNPDSGLVWADETANGNDAQGVTRFATGRYNTPGGASFDGADYVDLNGNTWYLLGAASVSNWGFTTVMVANITDHDDDRVIMSLGDSSGGLSYVYLRFATDGENLTVGYRDGYTFRESSTTGQNFSGADHIFTAVYRAADDIEVFVDGVSVLTYAGTAGLINVFDRYGLGGTADSSVDGNNGSDIPFIIAEARIYTGTWGASEREVMELNLMTTYGFAVPAQGTVVTIK